MVPVVLVVELSPKSQKRLVMLPVEVSLNATDSGAVPLVGAALKLATGGGTITVRSLYTVAKLSEITALAIATPALGTVPLANWEMLNDPTEVGAVPAPMLLTR